MKKEKTYFVHYSDTEGKTGNFKPVIATTRKEAIEFFNSFEKYKGCKIISIS